MDADVLEDASRLDASEDAGPSRPQRTRKRDRRTTTAADEDGVKNKDGVKNEDVGDALRADAPCAANEDSLARLAAEDLEDHKTPFSFGSETPAPAIARTPEVPELYPGKVKAVEYEIQEIKNDDDDDDDEAGENEVEYDQVKPRDIIFVKPADGVPESELRPAVANGDDSASESDEDEKELELSQRALARRDEWEPDKIEHEGVAARFMGPAYTRSGNRSTRTPEGPRPPGAVVQQFHIVPTMFQQENALRVVRYPEHINVQETEIILAKQVHRKVCRVVVQTEYGGLVVKQNHDGKQVPCMAPMDFNDLWARYSVPDKNTDITLDLICTGGPQCNQLWDPSNWGQIRWCRPCEKWFHARCLTHRVDVAALETLLDVWGQGYLKYLLPARRPHFAREDTPRMPFGWQFDPFELNYKPAGLAKLNRANDMSGWIAEDVHDEYRLYPMPKTTWAEVAALPIRRRTFPGEAPETIEVLIQHAIEQVEAGKGAEQVPDVGKRVPAPGKRRGTGNACGWLRDICPEAGLRPAKVILNKNLRQLRNTDGPRRFLCPNCKAQIL